MFSFFYLSDDRRSINDALLSFIIKSQIPHIIQKSLSLANDTLNKAQLTHNCKLEFKPIFIYFLTWITCRRAERDGNNGRRKFERHFHFSSRYSIDTGAAAQPVSIEILVQLPRQTTGSPIFSSMNYVPGCSEQHQ